MATLSSELIILFFALTATVFLWRFIRDKEQKNFSSEGFASSWKILLALLIPFSALIFSCQTIGLKVASSLPFFAGGMVLPYVLRNLGLSPLLRSLALLAAAVGYTLLVPADDFKVPTAALLAGLLIWKAAENFLLNEKSTLEDVVPTFLWLVGIYWTRLVDGPSVLAIHQKLILSTFIVAIFVRWIQGPFLKEDKLYVKRVTLATAGGLMLLVLVTKLIVAMELARICVIAGAGFFLSYLMAAMENSADEDTTAMKAFKQLLFIGIFSLLATRLFGTLGLIVLAATTLIATTSSAVCIAALFWGSRALLQAFVFDYNSNMTGINIMHNYTGAALYAGFLIAVSLSLLIKNSHDKRSCALLFLAACVIAPASANYFLHAEPTSSLLVSSLAGCVIISIFAKSFFGKEVEGNENVMLAPALLSTVAVLTAEFIEMGNAAETEQKLIALAALSVVSSLVLAAAAFLAKRENGSGTDNSQTPSEA